MMEGVVAYGDGSVGRGGVVVGGDFGHFFDKADGTRAAIRREFGDDFGEHGESWGGVFGVLAKGSRQSSGRRSWRQSSSSNVAQAETSSVAIS